MRELPSFEPCKSPRSHFEHCENRFLPGASPQFLCKNTGPKFVNLSASKRTAATKTSARAQYDDMLAARFQHDPKHQLEKRGLKDLGQPLPFCKNYLLQTFVLVWWPPCADVLRQPWQLLTAVKPENNSPSYCDLKMGLRPKDTLYPTVC